MKHRMLFLHISLSSYRMMGPYTKMIRDHFPMEEHRFLYLDALAPDDEKLLDFGNSIVLANGEPDRRKKVLQELDRADYIIWHGLIFGTKRVLLCLKRKYRRKSIWVMRGLDLYNWKKEQKTLKAFVCNIINYWCRKRIPNVGYIFGTDEEVYRKQFGNKAKMFYVPYPMPEEAFDDLEKYKDSLPRKNGTTYIQVNHNAFAFNRHLDILESIKPYAHEKIKVIIPLSYGNDWHDSKKGYVYQVQTCAEEYFGDKAVCLKRLIPGNQYTELLCNTDISIYGAPRQNGLGNILRSLYMGNKVFLSEDNPLYPFFKSKNIDVYSTESIPTLSYEEFIKPASSENATEWIRRNHHPAANMLFWKYTFDRLKGEPEIGSIEEEARIALEKVFPINEKNLKEEHGIHKLNYINLQRFSVLPKNTKMQDIQNNILIIGAGALGREIYQAWEVENKDAYRWDVAGFIDETADTLNGAVGECDIVGSFEDLVSNDRYQYVNAMESVESRKRVFDLLKQEELPMCCVVSESATLLPYTECGEGCVFLGNTYISGSAKIGNAVCIKSSYVDSEVTIGDYAIIESGCRICSGAVIGAGTRIGAGSRIMPNAHIRENQVIPPFSTVG